MISKANIFVNEKIKEGRAAFSQPEMAWAIFAKAHIASQRYPILHAKVHFEMLVLAVKTREVSEVVGQLLRIVLAAIGSLTGRYPRGNTGRSNMGIFQESPLSAEMETAVRDIEGPTSKQLR